MTVDTLRLLTSEELASELRVCTDTVRRMAKRGELPHIRVGRNFRFDLSAVREALKLKGADDAA